MRDALEEAREAWRKTALPDIEKALLQNAPQRAVAKTHTVKCNGPYGVQGQTRQGRFAFANQKFWCPEQGRFAFLHAAADSPSAVTQGRQAFAGQRCLGTASYAKARLALAEVPGVLRVTRETPCRA